MVVVGCGEAVSEVIDLRASQRFGPRFNLRLATASVN